TQCASTPTQIRTSSRARWWKESWTRWSHSRHIAGDAGAQLPGEMAAQHRPFDTRDVERGLTGHGVNDHSDDDTGGGVRINLAVVRTGTLEAGDGGFDGCGQSGERRRLYIGETPVTLVGAQLSDAVEGAVLGPELPHGVHHRESRLQTVPTIPITALDQ